MSLPLEIIKVLHEKIKAQSFQIYTCCMHLLLLFSRNPPFYEHKKRPSYTRRCNLEVNIFESSHFCQPLIEGNFTKHQSG